MADVPRLLEVSSREYTQWILKSVSSCWGGCNDGGGHCTTHMFLKCSNVLLFYCRCITEMKFNNLLYTIPIKLKRFSALLFIIAVQMSSDYSVCMYGQTSAHRGPHVESSGGWSLLENLSDVSSLTAFSSVNYHPKVT